MQQGERSNEICEGIAITWRRSSREKEMILCFGVLVGGWWNKEGRKEGQKRRNRKHEDSLKKRGKEKVPCKIDCYFVFSFNYQDTTPPPPMCTHDAWWCMINDNGLDCFVTKLEDKIWISNAICWHTLFYICGDVVWLEFMPIIKLLNVLHYRAWRFSGLPMITNECF